MAATYIGKCQYCGFQTEPDGDKSVAVHLIRQHLAETHQGWEIQTLWNWSLDELLPVVKDEDVPAGTPLYSSINETLAYIDGKWHRKLPYNEREDHD